jgi:hypothetical protein
MPNIDQVNLDLLEYDNISGLFTANKYNTSDKDPDFKLSPIERSLKILSENILISSYTIDDFKLRGVIQDVTPQITLDLGNREDVKLDDAFVIYENKIDNGSKVYSEYVGFGRVKEVGDNNKNAENRSIIFPIIGSYDQGYTAVSHSQIIDIVANIGYGFINIPKTVGSGLPIIGDGPIFKDDASSALNLGLGFYYNTAPLSNISQLFAGVNVSIGIPLVDQNTDMDNEFLTLNPTTTLEVNLAVMKKFWVSRMNFFTELEFGINTLKFTGGYPDGDWEINLGYNYGIGLNIGGEYAINKDLNLAFQAGYRFVLPVTEIVLMVDGKEEAKYPKDFSQENKDYFENTGLNDLILGGLRFEMRVSYSLQKLF